MQRSGDVAKAAKDFYAALSSGNMTALDALISREESAGFIGTDSAEWWNDRRKLIGALDAQTKEMEGFEFVPGDIEAFEHGDVGWFADRGTLKAPDGGETPLRITGTMIREDGSWKLVHGHGSVGAANAEVVGKDLTV